MRLKQQLVLCIAAVVGLYGCQSSGLGVTYNSSPQSARVICGGEFKGYTPTTLWYTIKESDIQRGTFLTVPCQAVWMSGTTATYRNQFPVQSNSHWYQINAVSPKVASVDLQFDHQRDLAIQAEQAEINRVIQGMNQPRNISTLCSKAGNMASCSSVAY